MTGGDPKAEPKIYIGKDGKQFVSATVMGIHDYYAEQRELAKNQPAPTTKPKPTKPAIDKGKVYVEVYNNSGVTGLAGEVAASATQAGWKVVGSDNWYGTIPASSVYYPPKLARAARALALDLGIRRTVPAVDPMKLDRLTVILTADHA